MILFPTSAQRSEFRKLLRFLWLLLAGIIAVGMLKTSAAQSKMIITWGGNPPEWNQKLHLNAIRIGCSSSPNGCAQAADKIAQEQHVNRVFLAILLTSSSVNYAQQYSALSRAHPVLYSVGFDDFVRQMGKLNPNPADTASLLNSFIDGLKSANPNLHFGVTVYVDELASPELSSPAMANVRNRTDYVHLFLHYREDGPNFAKYVQQANALFPNAQIIAGSYPMDRIDYLPCSRGARACTSNEEISLFEQAFDVQLRLLQGGSVVGIEFYPGNFGNIANAPMWKQPRSCHPDRLSECIANSTRMEEYVGEKLSHADF